MERCQFTLSRIFLWTAVAAVALNFCRLGLPAQAWEFYRFDLAWCGAPTLLACVAAARGQVQAVWRWCALGWLIALWCALEATGRGWQIIGGFPPPFNYFRPLHSLIAGLGLALGCALAPALCLACSRPCPNLALGWTRADTWMAVAVLGSTCNVAGVALLHCYWAGAACAVGIW